MGNKFVLATALILTFGLHGFAQSKTARGAGAAEPARAHRPPQKQTVQELASSVADAFGDKTLGSLDAGRPYVGAVRFVIEQSLGEFERESDRYTRKSFRTLEAAEQWLKSRETQDGEMTLPRRDAGALQRCRKGVCTFASAGGLHNILWLKKITYGVRRGRPYVKTVHLVAD